MPIHSKTKQELSQIPGIMLCALCLSVVLSFLASYHWIADLFSHFYIQYAAGSFILLILFLLLKKRLQAIVCSIILVYCAFHLQSHFTVLHKPTDAPEKRLENSLTVFHSNRKYTLQNHDAVVKYLRSTQPDVVVIQEATESHANVFESIRSLYPYQIHEPRTNAFGMLALSKCPISDQRIKPFERIAIHNFQMRFSFKCNGKEAVTLYAIHPPPPTSRALNQQRNMELEITAQDILADKSENIIMLGDWNITPFSPPFKNLLNKTGLKHEHTTYPPFTTWPSMFFAPFLQIPIDHILHKGHLQLVSKKRVPAMQSDHYPVIATYTFSSQN